MSVLECVYIYIYISFNELNISHIVLPHVARQPYRSSYRMEMMRYEWNGIDEVVIIVTILKGALAIGSSLSSGHWFACASQLRYELYSRHLEGIIIAPPSSGLPILLRFHVSWIIEMVLIGEAAHTYVLHYECAMCLHAKIAELASGSLSHTNTELQMNQIRIYTIRAWIFRVLAPHPDTYNYYGWFR